MRMRHDPTEPKTSATAVDSAAPMGSPWGRRANDRAWGKTVVASLALTGVVIASAPQPAHSAPARPALQTFTQSDGARFQARTLGDEWCSRVETVSGHTIAQDARGDWRFVHGYSSPGSRDQAMIRPVLGDLVTSSTPPAPLALHLQAPCQEPAQHAGHAQTAGKPFRDAQYTAQTPFTGSILFILASFQDREGTYKETEFAEFVRTEIRGFYETISYGAVSLQPARESFGGVDNGVVGWLKLNYKHPNTGSSTGSANQTLSKDALLAADRYVDFASYDRNNDGYVDSDELAVVVIAAGYERSYAMSRPAVWGHQWNLDAVTPPTLDGKIVGASHQDKGGYAQFGEIHKGTGTRDTGHLATVGIMVHELGHLIFRLPDLYDTDGSSNGIGPWCYMSYGSWGLSLDDQFSGETPVNAGAWVRHAMGWSAPLRGTGVKSLSAVGDALTSPEDSLLRVDTNTASEYFLVENRQPVGYDRGLEGLLENYTGGLAIWHVDESIGANRFDRRRLADIEEADNTLEAYASTNLWYAGNGEVFGKTSSPSSALNNGSSSGVTLSRFSASGDVMELTVEVAP